MAKRRKPDPMIRYLVLAIIILALGKGALRLLETAAVQFLK